MRQRAKIDWLRYGDKNNAYFHASLKSKLKHTQMHTLHMEDGTIIITNQADMEEIIKHQILVLTTFSEGQLPFRYLRIPLTSKKLFVYHCIVLVDLIVSRARHWGAKLLSFTGRIQLIRSVIFSMTNYWTQCIPLPKQIIKRVEAICRSFL